VQTEVLVKICAALSCGIENIMEILPEEEETK
jgi:DNA-binding Xre family transcriptional regulator